jgi:hypothetical protein
MAKVIRLTTVEIENKLLEVLLELKHEQTTTKPNTFKVLKLQLQFEHLAKTLAERVKLERA